MALITRWIEVTRPAAIVVDVSVEVALFVRLLGVPVIVMAMPGERTDAPHASVHQIADHIIAAWPRELYEPEWLRAYAAKTSYVGGISRFVGHEALQPTDGPRAHRPRSQRDRRMRLRPVDGRCDGGPGIRDPLDDTRSAGRSENI